MKFRIYPVDASRIIEVTELLEKYKKTGKKPLKSSLVKALKVSNVTVQNALGAIKQLKIDKISDKIANSTLEEQRYWFRKVLQDYEPFLEFISFMSKGNEPPRAIQKILELYDIKRKPEDAIWTFQNWGVFAGIFKNKNFEFSDLIKQLKPSKIAEFEEVLKNELKIKIWIKEIIQDADAYLTNEEYEPLIKAIMYVKENPRNSIKLAGEILEDVLRKIAKDKEVDVRKKNGISEIAEELRKNKILASKHIGILKGVQVFLDRNIFDTFSSFRNMAHHGIDKSEMKRWELSEELAISYVIQVILCIKSLYYYVIKNQLTF